MTSCKFLKLCEVVHRVVFNNFMRWLFLFPFFLVIFYCGIVLPAKTGRARDLACTNVCMIYPRYLVAKKTQKKGWGARRNMGILLEINFHASRNSVCL